MRDQNLYSVDCEWSDWSIGDCSKICGGGTRTKTRTEKLPAAHGGVTCEGFASIAENCSTHECPGDRTVHVD